MQEECLKKTKEINLPILGCVIRKCRQQFSEANRVALWSHKIFTKLGNYILKFTSTFKDEIW